MNQPSSLRLAEHTIVITGVNGLLGNFMRELFIIHGAKVIGFDLHDRPSAPQDHSYTYFKVDITCETQVKNVFRSLGDSSVIPNCLLNNACLNPKVENDSSKELTRLENLGLEEFNLHLNVSLAGSFLCSKYLYILSKSYSNQILNVVNISSDLGFMAPNQELYMDSSLGAESQPVKPLPYSIVKHGIHGLTRYLSTYDPKHLRSNTLAPSGIYTNQSEEFVSRIRKLIPMDRMSNLEDYAGVLLFLVSSESQYMTGTSIVVDGGRSTW